MTKVSVPVSGAAGLATRMGEMREWLGHHRFDVSSFTCAIKATGAAVEAQFALTPDAEAFASTFGGNVVISGARPTEPENYYYEV